MKRLIFSLALLSLSSTYSMFTPFAHAARVLVATANGARMYSYDQKHAAAQALVAIKEFYQKYERSEESDGKLAYKITIATHHMLEEKALQEKKPRAVNWPLPDDSDDKKSQHKMCNTGC